MLELKERLENTIENIPNFPKEGIQFKDISPIFLHPDLYEEVVEKMVNFSRGKVDVVCGIESRGYIFGIAIAVKLGVPFILIRKKGKLPPPFISEKYDLEYGTSEIEMKINQIQKGGTAKAAANLVKREGGKVTQFSFLIELRDLGGKEKLEQIEEVKVFNILDY